MGRLLKKLLVTPVVGKMAQVRKAQVDCRPLSRNGLLEVPAMASVVPPPSTTPKLLKSKELKAKLRAAGKKKIVATHGPPTKMIFETPATAAPLVPTREIVVQPATKINAPRPSSALSLFSLLPSDEDENKVDIGVDPDNMLIDLFCRYSYTRVDVNGRQIAPFPIYALRKILKRCSIRAVLSKVKINPKWLSRHDLPNRKYNLLELAIIYGSVPAIQLLITYGANMNSLSPGKLIKGSCSIVTEQGVRASDGIDFHPVINTQVTIFFRHWLDYNNINNLVALHSSHRPLMQLARLGILAHYEIYLYNGDDSVNLEEYVDNNGKTLLMYAAEAGDKMAVKMLIRHKVNINLYNHAGWTAYDYAVMYGHRKLYNYLRPEEITISHFTFPPPVATEPNIDEQLRHAIETAVHRLGGINSELQYCTSDASTPRIDYDVVSHCLKNGAQRNQKLHENSLHTLITASAVDLTLLRLLLNQLDPTSEDPLDQFNDEIMDDLYGNSNHISSEHYNDTFGFITALYEIRHLLYGTPYNINCYGPHEYDYFYKGGYTINNIKVEQVVHYAALLGVVPWLLGQHRSERKNIIVDVNARDVQGRTPLMLAIESDVDSNVSYLLKSGADPLLIDNNKHNSIFYALATGNISILQMIATYLPRKIDVLDYHELYVLAVGPILPTLRCSDLLALPTARYSEQYVRLFCCNPDLDPDFIKEIARKRGLEVSETEMIAVLRIKLLLKALI